MITKGSLVRIYEPGQDWHGQVAGVCMGDTWFDAYLGQYGQVGFTLIELQEV